MIPPGSAAKKGMPESCFVSGKVTLDQSSNLIICAHVNASLESQGVDLWDTEKCVTGLKKMDLVLIAGINLFGQELVLEH